MGDTKILEAGLGRRKALVFCCFRHYSRQALALVEYLLYNFGAGKG